MYSKILLLILLIPMLSLNGCTRLPESSPEILYGWDLQTQGYGYDDWGYTYNLPEVLRTDGRLYEPTVGVNPQWGAWEQWGYAANDLKGAYTRIDYEERVGNGFDENVLIPLMYLQHIPRSQLQHKPEARILVRGQEYTQQEMAPYLLFANERACVYDLTPFFITDWDAYWQCFVAEQEQELSPETAVEIAATRELLLKHRSELIQQAEAKELPHQQVSFEESRKPSQRNQDISNRQPFLFGYESYPGFVFVPPQALDTICLPGKLAYDMVPGDWHFAFNMEGQMKGDADILMCGDLPVFCWQTFYKADLILPEARIQIGEQSYLPEELSAYQLSESAITVLYDFTPLLLGEDFETYLAQSVDNKLITAEDAEWISDFRDILQTQRASLFVPCVQVVP